MFRFIRLGIRCILIPEIPVMNMEWTLSLGTMYGLEEIPLSVHIGNNVVIGSGSVVTKDIPDNTIAVGNPCRVLRQITEEDRDFYYKDRPFDVQDYKP